MAVTTETIKIPKLEGNVKTWFKLTGGTQYCNVGMQAEVGYAEVLAALPPTVFKGEQVLQNEIIDDTRGDIYVLQDAYFSYEFMIVG